MSESLAGIEIESAGERVRITVADGIWEGDSAQVERLLSGLHYALARARPGTGIGSMFLNDHLWGAKFVERDREQSIRLMMDLIDQMREQLRSMTEQPAGID
jgi:hypothetical protein